MKKLAVVFATVFALVGGSVAFSTPALADDCGVTISGGSVSNSTTIDLNADGGTAIGDASGGDDNIALTLGDDDLDTAAAGNAGTADAAANGGAIVVGDVNSGGNTGNTIEVGNTSCAPPPKPAPEEKKPEAPAPEKKAAPAKKAAVAALPDTGTGVAGDVNFGFIALALVGAVAAAGYSVRARTN